MERGEGRSTWIMEGYYEEITFKLRGKGFERCKLCEISVKCLEQCLVQSKNQN